MSFDLKKDQSISMHYPLMPNSMLNNPFLENNGIKTHEF